MFTTINKNLLLCILVYRDLFIYLLLLCHEYYEIVYRLQISNNELD